MLDFIHVLNVDTETLIVTAFGRRIRFIYTRCTVNNPIICSTAKFKIIMKPGAGYSMKFRPKISKIKFNVTCESNNYFLIMKL